MVRFIHAADIHLDSPLKGLERYEGAPVDEMRGATRAALENLVALAIDRAVNFVVIAGDLYDGDWKDHNTGLFFVGRMHRLREAGIPVVMISGNHDAANKMTKSLRLPDNVELLSHGRAATAALPVLRELGVAIHGRSFGEQAETGNLARDYPGKKAGMFNIGLLHTSLTGGREEHATYAPCDLDDLRSKGYDYWALGHIHLRETVCEDPPVVFAGNIQGRHIRERDAKGCCVVELEDGGRPTIEFVPLDVARWELCRVDGSKLKQPDDLPVAFAAGLEALDRKHGGMPLAVRVEVSGRTAAHAKLVADQGRWTNELRSAALGVAGGRVWVEKVKVLTQPLDAPRTADLSGPVAALRECLEELAADDGELLALGDALADLRGKLPEELSKGPEGLGFDDPDRLRGRLREWLREAEPLLMAALGEGAAS
jgi:DNA repair exonuclease SbcCD nuclease subunit